MKKTFIPIILIAAIFLILLLHINYLRFICDDAFISFRYAKNFVEGHGLVYNIGEKVEGYTNFLWTLLLSLFMKMGLEPVVVSQVLGILFSLATVFMLLRLNRWLYPQENLFNYLAPLLLVCCGAYAAWSTGGLETSFYTFLTFLGSFFFLSAVNQPKFFLFSGMTFSLVCMTRLDGLIFSGVTFMFLFYLTFVSKKIETRNFGIWILSFSAPFLIYFFWRWSYYGKFLPNTFYMKVREESLYQQGLLYLFYFVKRFYIWLLVIPLAFLGKAIKLNARLSTVIPYFSSMILFFSLYVVYVGGDFMDMFRFLVPILPFFFFSVQEGFRGMYYSTLNFSPPQRLSRRQRLTKHPPSSKRKLRIVLIISEIFLIGLTIFFLAYPSKESNQTWTQKGIDSIGALRESMRVWSKVGMTFKSIAKPGESLSTTAAGALPYYSELYTIDELGLTLISQSQSIYAFRDLSRPGHQLRVTNEFLMSRKPTYIFAHPHIYNEYQPPEDLFHAEPFSSVGYKLMVLPIKISDNETKYCYYLSLK